MLSLGFVLAFFFKVLYTAYKIDSEHIQICKVEILQITVNKIKVLSSF